MSDTKTKSQDFGELLKDYFAKLPQAGDLVKGTVVSIDGGIVRIDINGVTTGIVRGKELFAESQEYSNIKIGDEVEAIRHVDLAELLEEETWREEYWERNGQSQAITFFEIPDETIWGATANILRQLLTLGLGIV